MYLPADTASREGALMTDTEKILMLMRIMDKHDDAVNADDGGERPFNETGEVIEVISAVLDGDSAKPERDGWLA
jgi:hypothetical protein